MWKDSCHAGVDGYEGGRGRGPLPPFLYIWRVYIILSGDHPFPFQKNNQYILIIRYLYKRLKY